MKKELSQQEECTLTTELVYQGERSGVVGGYCEPGFPLYYVNDEMAAMLGYDSAAELTAAFGAQVIRTIHPEDLPQVEQNLGGRLYEGVTYETACRMPKKDGSWLWTVDKGKVIRAEDGRLAILSVCTDMSDFVRRQKELENREALSDYLFKNLPGGYVRCGSGEGLPIRYMSGRFLDILGWTEEDIRTRFHGSFLELVCPEGRETVRAYAGRILAGSAPQTPEDAIYRLRSREGERWVSDTTMKVTVGARASSSASSPM